VRILALETTGREGSLALLTADAHVAEPLPQLVLTRQLPPHQRTAQSLIPLIDELLDEASCQPAALGLICVATGPGSFTGLRIGVTTAKTLAYALRCPLVGVATQHAMAEAVTACSGRLWTVLDAQRGELFASCYPLPLERSTLVLPATTEILSRDAWLGGLLPGDTVLGPPLQNLAEELPGEVVVADPSAWAPSAASVGRVGWQKHLAGLTVDPVQLVPQYHRRSAAEEKADQTADEQAQHKPS
jgi:tRNA threonylcarbamoyladenosine biosynthesis protein TsaB